MFPSFFFDELVSGHAMEQCTTDTAGQTDSLRFKYFTCQPTSHFGLTAVWNARVKLLLYNVYAFNDVIRRHRLLS